MCIRDRNNMYGVTITELIKKMDFRNLTPEIDADKIVLSHPDVNLSLIHIWILNLR